MAFKMKRGAAPKYKDLGSSFKHYVDDVKEHQWDHSDDLQTDEEHDRLYWPADESGNRKKRTEREISAYDETKNEEKKEEERNKPAEGEASMLEEGRTDLASAAEAEPVEEEAALAMKSPMKDRITKYDDSDNEAKLHNKDYENNPNHQDGTYHKNK